MPSLTPNPRIKVHVVHEDDHVVVVNKMPGVVSEPGRSHKNDSVLNGLLAHDGGRFAAKIQRLGEARDWGLLHRLDRLTSGLLLVALDAESYDLLRADFEARTVRKTYLAIVRGELRAAQGEIDAPLLETSVGSTRISALDPRGKPALTRYRTLRRDGRYALLECDLVTGRMHQLRVHLASRGAPIAGDPIYDVGGRARPQGRRPDDPFLGLHAWRLAFTHPKTRAAVTVEGEPPRRFTEFAVSHGVWEGARGAKEGGFRSQD
ncbi:MAG: RluA family pseudouridine synthase [Phycisphaerae bacterium]|nr:RluA family pseudouridine synthase [Phycisphaerae bacterium]